MSHHFRNESRNRTLKAHLILGAILVAAALLLAHWPAAWPVVGTAAATAVVMHVGAALLAGLGVLVAGLGTLWSRTVAGRDAAGAAGATIRWARLYDVVVAMLSFGREARIRAAALDVAGLSPGERVLDVGCGTGTLALAARRRVGSGGAVHGVDAAAEMVARARTKAQRAGLDVAFDVATAQALPFADASFDVALCTLALHHLPDHARGTALAEMRRVVRPGGRVLIVEIGHGHGSWAALNPVALLHGHEARHMLDDAAAMMRDAGFRDVAVGPLGSGVLGYALGRVEARHG